MHSLLRSLLLFDCVFVFAFGGSPSRGFAELPLPVDIPAKVVDLGSLPKEMVELNELISSSVTFKARFIHSVYPQGSSVPQSTQGRLVFDSEYGLLWQVLNPYKEALWLSQDGIFRVSSSGKEKLIEDSGVFGKVREFIEGRYSDFSAEGPMYFGAVKDQWEIRVSPQVGVIAAKVSEIRIRGIRGLLSWVRIVQKDKTVSSIRLYDMQRYEQSLGESQFFFLEPQDDFLPLK